MKTTLRRIPLFLRILFFLLLFLGVIIFSFDQFMNYSLDGGYFSMDFDSHECNPMGTMLSECADVLESRWQLVEDKKVTVEEILLDLNESRKEIVALFDKSGQWIDLWGRRVRVSRRQDGNLWECRSAGPDGSFDTHDDIARLISPIIDSLDSPR